MRSCRWPALNPDVNEPPRGHVRVVYLGPGRAPLGGPLRLRRPAVIDEFRARVLARLELLPPHDPQFRRNRERVVRDAERENLLLDGTSASPKTSRRDRR